MRCKCGEVSYISAEDYYAEPDEAHMPCEHCPRSIHFGPAVAALRDEDDPALDNARINTLAWYHTSTSPHWPAMAGVDADVRRAELAENARSFRIPADRIERLIDEELNKAPHVGTYEAAIENMLRRIPDQNDDQTAFYLHRVALKVGPDRVTDGYRDENHEPAAQLTTMDLRVEGLDAVRYLNVRESLGSISLAVLPETIAWVQTVGLPVTSLTPAHSASLVRMLDRVQSQLDALRAAEPETSAMKPRQLRLMQLREGEPGPDGIAAASAAHSRRVGGLRGEVTTALREEYLTGVRPWSRRGSTGLSRGDQGGRSGSSPTFSRRARSPWPAPARSLPCWRAGNPARSCCRSRSVRSRPLARRQRWSGESAQWPGQPRQPVDSCAVYRLPGRRR